MIERTNIQSLLNKKITAITEDSDRPNKIIFWSGKKRIMQIDKQDLFDGNGNWFNIVE